MILILRGREALRASVHIDRGVSDLGAQSMYTYQSGSRRPKK